MFNRSYHNVTLYMLLIIILERKTTCLGHMELLMKVYSKK